jgi:tRNA pseudouridine55 synthase
MTDGIINVYKEKGYTSHDVVARMRGILKMKKIGHTGTLDPEAEGVLPVCLGKGTKLCDLFTDKDKTYEAVLLLGYSTDTQDMTGKILSRQEVDIQEEQLQEVIRSFAGEYMQIPPMYSALKVNGKKLYELARQGREVERQPRPVHIYEIEVLKMDLPRVHMRISCSKGTYIRTLCHDIGSALGCGGCMESLLRTRVGRFRLEESLKLDEIEELVRSGTFENAVTTVDAVFAEYPKITADISQDRLLHNGNAVSAQYAGQTVRMYDSLGQFIGLYAAYEDKSGYKPLKMFYSR